MATENIHVGSPYCQAEMYHVTCYPLVSHREYAYKTDRWKYGRPLHYTFYYGRGAGVQRVDRLTCDQQVVGSIPTRGKAA